VPIVVSHVSASDYGRFVTAMAVMDWLLPLTAPAAAHGVAAATARGQDGTLVFVVRGRLKLAAIAAAGAVAVSYVLSRSGDYVLAWLVLASAGFLLLGSAFLTFRQFLVGKRAFRVLASWDVALATLPSLGMVVAAVSTGSIIVVAVATFGAQVLLALAGHVWIVRKWRLEEQFRLGRIERATREYGLKMIPLTGLSTLAMEGSTFLAAYVLGFEQLAVLAVAQRLSSRLSRIAGDVARDLLRPEFASRAERHLTRILRRNLASMVLALGGLWVVSCLGGAVYLTLFMPEAYGGAAWLFVLMSFGLPASILQDILLLIPGVDFRAVDEALPSIVEGVSRVVGTALLGYWLGGVGVALAIAVGSWAGVVTAVFWGKVIGRRDPVMSTRG